MYKKNETTHYSTGARTFLDLALTDVRFAYWTSVCKRLGFSLRVRRVTITNSTTNLVFWTSVVVRVFFDNRMHTGSLECMQWNVCLRIHAPNRRHVLIPTVEKLGCFLYLHLYPAQLGSTAIRIFFVHPNRTFIHTTHALILFLATFIHIIGQSLPPNFHLLFISSVIISSLDTSYSLSHFPVMSPSRLRSDVFIPDSTQPCHTFSFLQLSSFLFNA